MPIVAGAAQAPPPAYWLKRKTTNSAGFTGASPTSIMSCPRSRTSSRIVLGVALDEERLGPAYAPNSMPSRQQPMRNEVTSRRTRAQRSLVVRLEHDPLRAAIDGLLDVVEQPAHVDVSPRRDRSRACARPTRGAPRPTNERMQFTPIGLSTSCSPLVICDFGAQRAAHDFIGRRLVHATLVVAPRIDAGDVAAGRHARSAGHPGR